MSLNFQKNLSRILIISLWTISAVPYTLPSKSKPLSFQGTIEISSSLGKSKINEKSALLDLILMLRKTAVYELLNIRYSLLRHLYALGTKKVNAAHQLPLALKSEFPRSDFPELYVETMNDSFKNGLVWGNKHVSPALKYPAPFKNTSYIDTLLSEIAVTSLELYKLECKMNRIHHLEYHWLVDRYKKKGQPIEDDLDFKRERHDQQKRFFAHMEKRNHLLKEFQVLGTPFYTLESRTYKIEHDNFFIDTFVEDGNSGGMDINLFRDIFYSRFWEGLKYEGMPKVDHHLHNKVVRKLFGSAMTPWTQGTYDSQLTALERITGEGLKLDIGDFIDSHGRFRDKKFKSQVTSVFLDGIHQAIEYNTQGLNYLLAVPIPKHRISDTKIDDIINHYSFLSLGNFKGLSKYISTFYSNHYPSHKINALLHRLRQIGESQLTLTKERFKNQVHGIIAASIAITVLGSIFLSRTGTSPISAMLTAGFHSLMAGSTFYSLIYFGKAYQEKNYADDTRALIQSFFFDLRHDYKMNPINEKELRNYILIAQGADIAFTEASIFLGLDLIFIGKFIRALRISRGSAALSTISFNELLFKGTRSESNKILTAYFGSLVNKSLEGARLEYGKMIVKLIGHFTFESAELIFYSAMFYYMLFQEAQIGLSDEEKQIKYQLHTISDTLYSKYPEFKRKLSTALNILREYELREGVSYFIPYTTTDVEKIIESHLIGLHPDASNGHSNTKTFRNNLYIDANAALSGTPENVAYEIAYWHYIKIIKDGTKGIDLHSMADKFARNVGVSYY